MGMEDAVKELYRRREKAKLMGGEKRVKRQHNRGRLTARERLEKLLDPDSFWEMGLLNTSNVSGKEDITPCDGKIAGVGKIDGRKVAVFAQDPTVLGGSGGRVAHRKADQLKRMANAKGYPVIGLGDGVGGIRLPEQMGSSGMCGDKNIGGGSPELGRRLTRETPKLQAIMGECFGAPAWEAAAADFVVMVKGGAMGAAGPRIIEQALGQKVTPQELCGWEIHANYTGLVDAFAENDEEALGILRNFLSYMPSHNGEEPPYLDTRDDPCRRLENVGKIVTDQLNRAYDMYRLIRLIVDNGKYFPLKAEWARAMVTCLARIGGHVVGIIGNNPLYNAGAPDVPAMQKEINFLCLCDSFNIPIIFLTDVPGNLPGVESERQKLPLVIMVLLQAIGLVTVPKIAVLIRKAYGIGWRCMGVSQDDMHAAWPIASISFVDPATGIEQVYGRKLSESQDREAEKERLLKEWALDCAPWGGAQTTPLEIIDPADTRKWIFEALDILRGNRNHFIGRHLLANWPTGF